MLCTTAVTALLLLPATEPTFHACRPCTALAPHRHPAPHPAQDKKVFFVTNNATKSRKAIVAKLATLGLEASDVSARRPAWDGDGGGGGGARVDCLGRGMVQLIERAGCLAGGFVGACCSLWVLVGCLLRALHFVA